MVSQAERRGIIRIAHRCGVGFDAVVRYLTGQCRPPAWIARTLELEFGPNWKERFSQEAT